VGVCRREQSLQRFRFHAKSAPRRAETLTGPHTGGMVVLVRDPFELYEPAELYLQEQLNPDEVAAVTALAPTGDWQDF
jgi:hypothetical protein